MKQIYPGVLNKKIVLLFSLLLFSFAAIKAQTTITTLPNPPYNGGNSLASPANISFVIENTNSFPINITSISNWCTTAENNSLWQLWYSATSLSGTVVDVTVAPFSQIASSLATPVAASGITQLNFPGLNFTIPASTQYRFVLRNLGPGNTRYSGTAASTPKPYSVVVVPSALMVRLSKVI